MGILDRFILMPGPEQWPLVGPLTLLMLIFFLPYIGLLLVSATLSVALRPRWPGAARDLIDLGGRHPAAWLVCGILPLVLLIVLYSQYLYQAPIPVGPYLARILGITIAGFAALIVYRRTLMLPAGALGVLLLGGSAFHFVTTLSLIAHPQMWSMARHALPFTTTIQSLVHFLIFMAVSMLLTGGAILFIRFQWPEGLRHAPAAEEPLLRGLGWGVAIAGAAAIPPLLIWDYLTVPVFALAPRIFTPGLLMVAALTVALLATLAMLRGRHARFGWLVFVLGLVVMGLFAHKQQTMASVANQEHELLMTARIAEQHEELLAVRESLYASSAVIDPELGRQIFTERCSACHAFDHKVVGPPYDDVLPKYGRDLERLTDYIYKPVKVNPDFPKMPRQGLKRSEARSVAAFLIEQATGEPIGTGANVGDES